MLQTIIQNHFLDPCLMGIDVEHLLAVNTNNSAAVIACENESRTGNLYGISSYLEIGTNCQFLVFQAPFPNRSIDAAGDQMFAICSPSQRKYIAAVAVKLNQAFAPAIEDTHQFV